MNVGVTSFHHILIYSHLFIVPLFIFSSFPPILTFQPAKVGLFS